MIRINNKKIILVLAAFIFSAVNGWTQIDSRARYLQVVKPEGGISRIGIEKGVPYFVKTALDENNQLRICVYKNTVLIDTYPAYTRIYPRYEDPSGETVSIRGYADSTETENTVTPPNVIFVKEDINSKIVSLDETGLLTMQNDPIFSDIRVGDILYSLPTEQFPDGYALKIKKNPEQSSAKGFSKNTLQAPNNNICYATEPAAIDEVFEKWQCSAEYEVIEDKNKVIEYDIAEQINGMGLPTTPFWKLPFDNPTVKIKPVVDGWSKYTTNKRRLKVLSINKDKATAEYVLFDKDDDFKTTNDQVILEVTLKYDLANTHIHTDYHFENGIPVASTFGITGYHNWSAEMSLKFSPEKDWTKDAKKEWENKLKTNMLNKKFLIFSLPLAATSPTSFAVNPKFDIFFEITCDVNGEFKLTGGVTNVRYTFDYQWSAAIPDFDKREFNIIDGAKWYANAELAGSINVGYALGMGLTFDFPALKLATGKKSFVGIYGDYGIDATFEAKLSATTDKPGTCFDMGGSFVVEPSVYAEYELNLTKTFSVSDKTENLLELLSNSTGEWFDYLRIEEPILEYHYCTKEPSPVITGNSRDITDSSAIITGEIIADFPIDLSDKGFYYSTENNPIGKNGTKIPLGEGLASFFYTLTNLTPNTTYYYVAYGEYGLGTCYGEVKTFTTSNNAAPAIYYSDFNDNVFDTDFWHKDLGNNNENDIRVEDGMMKLEQNQTDVRTHLVSKDISFNESVTIERDVYLHRANSYYNAFIAFAFNNNRVIKLEYNHDSYSGLYGYNLSYGIGGLPDIPSNPIAIRIDSAEIQQLSSNVIFDELFHERIVIKKNGQVEYYQNNTLLGKCNIGNLVADATTFNIRFNPWGWWTGHQHYFDNFSIK